MYKSGMNLKGIGRNPFRVATKKAYDRRRKYKMDMLKSANRSSWKHPTVLISIRMTVWGMMEITK